MLWPIPLPPPKKKIKKTKDRTKNTQKKWFSWVISEEKFFWKNLAKWSFQLKGIRWLISNKSHLARHPTEIYFYCKVVNLTSIRNHCIFFWVFLASRKVPKKILIIILLSAVIPSARFIGGTPCSGNSHLYLYLVATSAQVNALYFAFRCSKATSSNDLSST